MNMRRLCIDNSPQSETNKGRTNTSRENKKSHQTPFVRRTVALLTPLLLPAGHTSALLTHRQSTSSTIHFTCNTMTQRHNYQLRHRLTTAITATKTKLKDDNDADDRSSNDDVAPTATTNSGNFNKKSLISAKVENNVLIKRNVQLQRENEQLQQRINQLLSSQQQQQQQQHLQQPKSIVATTKANHNSSSHHDADIIKLQQKPIIVALERFEGGGGLVNHHHHYQNEVMYDLKNSNHDRSNRAVPSDIENGDSDNVVIGNVIDENSLWCDEVDVYDGTCPIEPNVQFVEALRDRATWLIGLLIVQSISGIILSRNELLLQNHPSIIYFLTMLVGAGGNAGNQASVRVIRGIAIGVLQKNNYKVQIQFLLRELKMAFFLSIILSIIGFARTVLFSTTKTPLSEAIAITVALYMIVFTSICLGAILPFILQRMKLDPAHSSTSIQVIMDILGVFLTVAVTSLLLDSPFGRMITVSHFTQ